MIRDDERNVEVLIGAMHSWKSAWFGLAAAGLLVFGCGTDSTGTGGGGRHTGSGMIEVDFGNPEAPIGNYPPWDDTMDDPHGRATELTALGPVISNFYEFGFVENLCNGPCDADDL